MSSTRDILCSKYHKMQNWFHNKAKPTIKHYHPKVDKTVDLASESTYAMGVMLSNLNSTFSFPDPALAGIAMGWNYADAIGLITKGIHEFLADENYHRSKYPQALINILGGLQAFAFTYMPPLTTAAGIGPLALAGPAFAFEELCSLISKSIDFYHIHKQKKFSGWLEEKDKEIKNLTKLVIKLRLKMMKSSKHNIKQQEKIIKLSKKIENSLKEIISRSRIFFNTPHDHHQDEKINELLNHLQVITDILSRCHQPPDDVDQVSDVNIQNAIKKKDKQARNDVIMKSLSFLGMVFLAVAPFTGPAAPFVAIPGLIIVSLVTIYYLYKHRHDIKRMMMDLIRFLKDKYNSLKNTTTKLKNKASIVSHSLFHKNPGYHHGEEHFLRHSHPEFNCV